MVYRAKITHIQSWIEENYNLNEHPIVRDARDSYIEVDSEEEAESIARINSVTGALDDAKAYHRFLWCKKKNLSKR